MTTKESTKVYVLSVKTNKIEKDLDVSFSFSDLIGHSLKNIAKKYFNLTEFPCENVQELALYNETLYIDKKGNGYIFKVSEWIFD